MVQVIQYVNQIFSSNMYVIHAKENLKDIWLVDVGDINKILDDLPMAIIRGVFITHSHFDHIYGINELMHHFPSCIIYISEDSKDGLYSAKKNFSFYHGCPIVCSNANIHIIREGDRIELPDAGMLSVYETPGHDMGCLTYSIDDYLFTGDSFIPGIKVVTKLRGGNRVLAAESVRRIKNMIHGGIKLCPGHNDIEYY